MKNGLTITVGVLLLFYALGNLGGGVGTWAKAGTLSGLSSMNDSLRTMTKQQMSQGERNFRQQSSNTTMLYYALAIVILGLALLSLITAIGLFSGQPWAANALLAVVIIGALVECQDLMEDGFGLLSVLWIGTLVLAAVAVGQLKQAEETTQPAYVTVEDD